MSKGYYKPVYYHGRFMRPFMKCPGCDETIDVEEGVIEVNCETKGRVFVDKMWTPLEKCDNPTCPWSRMEEPPTSRPEF